MRNNLRLNLRCLFCDTSRKDLLGRLLDFFLAGVLASLVEVIIYGEPYQVFRAQSFSQFGTSYYVSFIL